MDCGADLTSKESQPLVFAKKAAAVGGVSAPERRQMTMTSNDEGADGELQIRKDLNIPDDNEQYDGR